MLLFPNIKVEDLMQAYKWMSDHLIEKTSKIFQWLHWMNHLNSCWIGWSKVARLRSVRKRCMRWLVKIMRIYHRWRKRKRLRRKKCWSCREWKGLNSTRRVSGPVRQLSHPIIDYFISIYFCLIWNLWPRKLLPLNIEWIYILIDMWFNN